MTATGSIGREGVLAVLDRAARRYAVGSQAGQEMREARAAIAEVYAQRDSLRNDIAEMYEAMPALPITSETVDAATDWMTRFCIDFSAAIARCEPQP